MSIVHLGRVANGLLRPFALSFCARHHAFERPPTCLRCTLVLHTHASRIYPCKSKAQNRSSHGLSTHTHTSDRKQIIIASPCWLTSSPLPAWQPALSNQRQCCNTIFTTWPSDRERTKSLLSETKLRPDRHSSPCQMLPRHDCILPS